MHGHEPPGRWSEAGAHAGGLFRDANVFSDKAALEILKEGETCCLEDYERMLRDTASVKLRPLIGKLVTKQRAHIRSLDGLMSRLENGSSEGEKHEVKGPVTRPSRVRCPGGSGLGERFLSF